MASFFASAFAVVGLGLMAFAFFVFDPTVSTPGMYAVSSMIDPDRTVNLQRLSYQLMIMIAGAAFFVGGCILALIPQPKSD